MKEETSLQFRETANEFMQVLEQFNETAFNEKPFEKSWSAGQVAEHIFLSVKGIPKLFEMKTATEKSDYAKNMSSLKAIFLNFDIKLDAPAFIIPEDKPYDKGQLLASLRTSFEEISAAIAQHDLSEVIADVPFPNIGAMSRYEWIWFSVFHMQRHILQLKEIHKFVQDVM